MKVTLPKNASLKFINLCKIFFTEQVKFDNESIVVKQQVLNQLLEVEFASKKFNIQLHNALLFSLVYPVNEEIYKLTDQVMQKLVQTVSRKVVENADEYYNSGISGSMVCARFGLLLNQWLLIQNTDMLQLSSIEGENSDLVSKLTFTLNPVEQELMPDDACYYNEWKEMYLGSISDNTKLLTYYVNACLQMTGSISYKESIFSGFDFYTQFLLDKKLQGLSLGRQTKGEIHFHPNGIQKKTDLELVIKQGKPKAFVLTTAEKINLVNLARGTMASLLRETDTFSYAQIPETELFDMHNGISVALYYMIPEQKFALQSYVGYLLFKNGVPMAYGGCWLFARQAAFGVNVLPPYRGGESANVVCQLLRLYFHRFQLQQFTVDPYQIGQGNEDGISSGAFWFYYKLGFRPMQKQYAELADAEMLKMAIDKSYKTPLNTLIILANSELYWKQKDSPAVYYPLLKVSEVISRYVCDYYAGNRRLALNAAKLKYMKQVKKTLSKNSFLNNLLLTLEAIGAFEKLSAYALQKVCEAYTLKGKNEANAFIEIQKVKKYCELFESKIFT
ncbi:MAG: hypothetical protein H7296_16025 [Bacteroidia bacterium]|nr:hypothetical protein [Bacteroidia bacterium]